MAFPAAWILISVSLSWAQDSALRPLALPDLGGAAEAVNVQALKPLDLKNFQLDLNFKLPQDIKLEPEWKRIKSIRSYMENGGDISGGGFGLFVGGSRHVVLHDLWCDNHDYVSAGDLPRPNGLVPARPTEGEALSGWPLDLDSKAPAEKNLAKERLKAWRPMAPELIDQALLTLEAKNVWFGSFLAPADNPIDQFEFPGTAAELEAFHQKYQEIQVGRVERFTGRIYLTSGLWDRMDLKSRAGLLVHESLRRVYLRSIAGYLRPSILQWMTGAIMLREPLRIPLNRRIFESFYEELFANLEGNSELENHRPANWRGTLCKDREALADSLEKIVNASEHFGSLGRAEARETICRLQSRAREQDARANAWIPMVSFRNLPDCQSGDLPVRLQVYWFQKALGLGWNWTTTTGRDKVFPHDLRALLRSEPNILSREAYLDLIRTFRDKGNEYCPERRDRYGAGAEFSGLGDVLLETASHFGPLEPGPAFVASFKDPRRNAGLIDVNYRDWVLKLYRQWMRSGASRD